MVRSPTSVLRLLVGLTVTALGVVVAWRFSNTMAAFDHDWEQVTDVLPPWIRAIPSVMVALTLLLVPVAVNVQLLRYRRWRLLLIVNVAAVAAFLISDLVVTVLTRQPPSMFPHAYSDANGSVNDPLLAAFVAAFVLGLSYLPRSARRLGTATVALSLLAALGFSDVPAVGWLVDVGIGAVCGAAVSLVFGTPDSAPDRDELIAGLARSGIELAGISKADVDARGSTPWFGTTVDGRNLFIKVLGQDNRSADLMFRAFRAVFLRNSGDERPMSSLRRSVEHEALMSLRATAAGIGTPELLTVSEVGTDAMLLTFAAVEGRSLDRVPPGVVTDTLLDDLWRQVVVLQAHGIAHRDLRLANVFVDSAGAVQLIDWGFAELAASPLLMATDLAEVIASTTTVVGTQRAVDAAERAVGAAGLVRAHSRLQPAALGGATRSALKESGELDVLRSTIEDRADIPGPDYDGSVPRRGWPAAVVFAFAAAVTAAIASVAAGNGAIAGIERPDQIGWLLGAAAVAWVASIAVVTGSLRDPVGARSLLLTHVASSWAELLRPMHTASTALRVRVQLARGVDTATALGSVGLVIAARSLTHVAVLYLTVRLSGHDGSIDLAVDPDPAIVAAAVATVLLLWTATVLSPLRRRVLADVLAPVRHAPGGFKALSGHAMRLVQLVVGSMFVAFAAVGGLVAADRVFGGELDPPSIALTALSVTLLVALLPVPGGAGLAEAGMVAGLVLLGEHAGAAVPAVVLFRVVWTWLPAAVGCWAAGRLRRQGRLDERAPPQSAAGTTSGS